MTVQRRLLIWLLTFTVALWIGVSLYAYLSAKHEIDELFDTQQVALAGLVLSTEGVSPGGEAPVPPGNVDLREADADDLAIALWTVQGRLLMSSGAAAGLDFGELPEGFSTLDRQGVPWVVFVQRDPQRQRVVAVAQNAEERSEVLVDLVLSQFSPWMLILPVLVAGIVIAVRAAFGPLRALARQVESRDVNELTPIGSEHVTADVAPLVASMNRLFGRMREALEHERRLTADASHELRTPLAALRAQWDALELSSDGAARAHAMARIGEGLERLSRLVDQLLSLSALESNRPDFDTPVDWERVVQRAVNDSWAAIERAEADLQVSWPEDGVEPLPLLGDESLLSLALRNLVHNACRYSPKGVVIRVVIGPDRVEVSDDGPGLPTEVLERLGARFLRGAGQAVAGSGLGISIVLRVAEMHGLSVTFTNRSAGSDTPEAGGSGPAAGGLSVTLAPRPAGRGG